MAIDTFRKRESALIDPWTLLRPDGTIDALDRATLLGEYSGIQTLPPAGSGSTGGPDIRLYDANNRRKWLPQTWITEATVERRERGGDGIGSLRLLATWEELESLEIDGTEYVDVWLYGVRIYRGRVRQPDWSIDSPEIGTLNLSGLIETLDQYLVECTYAYSQETDLATIGAQMIQDWAIQPGRLPNLVVVATPIGVTVKSFDARGKTLAAALNALCDMAPNQCLWGCDADEHGRDRATIGPRSTDTAYWYTVGGRVSAVAYPRDYGTIRNRLHISGGPAPQPNLLTNGSFEEDASGSELAGNLLLDYSFEDGTPSAYWTLSGGATVKYIGHPTAFGSPRTGRQWLELDTNGEQAEQVVYIIPGGQFTASCWARREDPTIANTFGLEIEGLDAGGTVVTYAYTGAQDPGPSGVYKRYTLSQDWSAYPTVVKARARVLAYGGTASNDGILVDDMALYTTDQGGQTAWRLLCTGAAQITSYDWQVRIPRAFHGGYCVKLHPNHVGSSADTLEMYQPKDAYVSVAPNERYTLCLRWQTNLEGSAALSFGVAPYDSAGTVGAVIQSPTISGDYGTWQLARLDINTPSDAASLQIFIRARANAAVYIDALLLVKGDIPDEVLTHDSYWPGANYEAILDTTTSGLSLSTEAAASQATYGIREAPESNENVTDWDTAAAFGTGYFNAKAIPAVQASLRALVGNADDLLSFAGLVRLRNLPNAPAPLFPTRIRHQIRDSVELQADLGNDRPTLAQMLRLAAERNL